VKRSFVAYCFAGLVAVGGAAALAQSSAPPLRIVPMGESERPAKAPVKKTPAKAPVTKAPATKAPAPKAAATKSVTPTRSPSSAAPAARPSSTTQATRTTAARAPAPKAATPTRTASTTPATPARASTTTPTRTTPLAPRAATPATPRPSATAVAAATPSTTGAMGAADWRPLDPENAILYETTKGKVIVELAPELAPGHVARIKELAREGFYNGLAFHRVIDTFMAQGGDPKGDGTGGSDKPNLRGEFNFRRGADTSFVRAVDRGGAALGWVRTVPVTSQPDILMERTADKRVAAWANHCPGVTSMARAEDENSANSQFFLMRASYPTLDRRYTVWGRAVIGLDVIRALKVGEPVVEPDRMVKVRVLSDVPEAERPKVMIQRTDGPMFKARLATALEERGAAFSNCDLAPEGRIVP
jgi:peptidylprolyl isomerase